MCDQTWKESLIISPKKLVKKHLRRWLDLIASKDHNLWRSNKDSIQVFLLSIFHAFYLCLQRSRTRDTSQTHANVYQTSLFMQYILRFNYAFVSVMADLLNLIAFNLWNEFPWLTSKRYSSCSKSYEAHFLHINRKQGPRTGSCWQTSRSFPYSSPHLSYEVCSTPMAEGTIFRVFPLRSLILYLWS